MAQAFWSSHARLSVNRHKWLFPRSDNLQVFVVAQAILSSHAGLFICWNRKKSSVSIRGVAHSININGSICATSGDAIPKAE